MNDNESTDSTRQEQLNQVIAAYLDAARRGPAPDRKELLSRHPELATELQAFFADHDKMNEVAEPLRPAGEASPGSVDAEEFTEVVGLDAAALLPDGSPAATEPAGGTASAPSHKFCIAIRQVDFFLNI